MVAGLGAYDGALGASDLTDAVRAGVLRYLLQVVDVLGPAARELPLATLLLGYNSSASLSVASSVEALVRGVLEANAKFRETTRLDIRVSSLSLVELYLDTAISAVYALREMPDRLAGVALRANTLLACQPELEHGEGLRQRLFDGGGQSYWPRLIVGEDPRDDEGGSATPAKGTRLRYLYLGPRARAEAVVQQRQPGLIEALVRRRIHGTAWQEDVGRMLFQLLVPHDFKDTVRQLARVVLVVDAATAQLPWELMLADAPGRSDAACRSRCARRSCASSPRHAFRRQVHQAIERTALVVGNPSVEGFGAAFPDPRHPEGADPPPLPGAEAEASAVAGVLGSLDYRVTQAIGADQRASDVLALLYAQPYRIVHIAAHGVFELLHRDGLRRSGVVLSDGLLITAAEIAAMEAVPELVFLSCCHLGQIDTPTHAHRARRQQARRERGRRADEIGVRCVVVAGWAVDDAQAQLFGETFYRGLLQQRLPFGDAVHQARRAVWERRPDDLTWGAFQAYGDPGWCAEPREPGVHADTKAEPFASPEELLDALASLRAELSRRRPTERAARATKQAIEQLITARCPPAWQAQPALQSALAGAWRDLGRDEDARGARPPQRPAAGQDVEAAPPIAAIACKRGKGRQRTLAQQSAGLQFGAAHEQRGQARRGCAGRPIFRAGARRVG